MARRRGLVREGDVVAGIATDRVGRAQREALAHPRCARGAAFDDERPDRPCLRALGLHRSLQDAEGAEEEDIEEEQEGDADGPQQHREGDLHRALVDRAEDELEAADRDLIAVIEDPLGDAPAVHVGAVGALQVVQRVTPEPKPDLGVLA